MKSRRRPSKTCSCSTAAGLKALEGTPEGNLNLSALVSANPALTMLFGQPGALDTVDGLVVWRTLLIGGIFAGFMGIYLVTRNVKAPEDNGQVELLASASVGSFSRLSAGLLVASLASLVLVSGLLGIRLANRFLEEE